MPTETDFTIQNRIQSETGLGQNRFGQNWIGSDLKPDPNPTFQIRFNTRLKTAKNMLKPNKNLIKPIYIFHWETGQNRFET